MSFTHLHLHTEYSLLDGAIRIDDLPDRLLELGMSSCAITDHGVLYGTIDFYRKLKKAGIKPILGCEVYVAPRSLRDKTGVLDKKPYHLILLAESQKGWHNLIKLCSLGFTEGFYYRPRLDMALLAEYHEGLIALSACCGGKIPRTLLEEGYAAAKEEALRHEELFGKNNFFLEIQDNGLPEQVEVNAALAKIAYETGIPLVATNDCHYLRPEDARAQDVLMCLNTGKKINDPDRMSMCSEAFYLKSPAEMEAAFPELPEAIRNTERIAERCQADIEFGRLYLPEFKPENGLEAEPFLRQIAAQGLAERLAARTVALSAAQRELYEQRLQHELNVIASMGYTSYYLIVWDYIRYAKEKNIMVGPGRGSGAASLAAYCLFITNVDPLEYDLIFERFLNPERVSLPDFDCDFADNRRAEMIDYVTQKYGSEHVCQVITFGTLAAKACIRDVARVLDYPYAEADRLSKMIPAQLNIKLEQALQINSDLRSEYEQNPQNKELIDLALKLEGMPRHASTHAAGVIIAGVPVAEVAPLSLNDEAVVVQYTKDNIEDIGLLKFDFLGLRILTVMQDTAAFVLAKTGRKLDFDNMSYDDEAIYKMLSEGKTAGVFQLENSGMTAFIKEMKPQGFEDIIAGISLYRPGPMEQIPRYIANGKVQEISYAHPLLEAILHNTRGCMVYQEQVMRIVRELAGFSMGQADNVRRAMSKKKPEILANYRQLFIYGGKDEKGKMIEGAVARGVPAEVAGNIFEETMAFAGYAFNKPHATGYAVLAYQTAWLKHYYPVEFMAATLNSFLGDLSKAANYVAVCKDMGIAVLPPDINASNVRFQPEAKAIRFALGAIKNVSETAIRKLVAERESQGAYSSFANLVQRLAKLELNRKQLESLIKSSALDCFAQHRSQMLDVAASYLQQIQQSQKKSWEGQLSLFDLGAVAEDVLAEPSYPPLQEYPNDVLLAQEKEVLGIYVSGHPLSAYHAFQQKHCNLCSIDLSSESNSDCDLATVAVPLLQDRQLGVIMGQLVKQRVLLTRKQEQMAFLSMEDLQGSFELILFPKTYQQYRHLLLEGAVFMAKGQVTMREDEDAKLIVDELFALTPESELNLPDVSSVTTSGQSGTKSASSVNDSQSSQQGSAKREAVATATVRERGSSSAEPKLILYWDEAVEPECNASFRAMLRYFAGSGELWLWDGKGKLEQLAFGYDRELLVNITERYGIERATFV